MTDKKKYDVYDTKFSFDEKNLEDKNIIKLHIKLFLKYSQRKFQKKCVLDFNNQIENFISPKYLPRFA